VHPGGIEATGMFPTMGPEDAAARAKQIPLQRFGRPDDVSALVMFLLSDDSSYITGTEQVIDGGATV